MTAAVRHTVQVRQGDLAPFVVGAVSLEPGPRGGLVPYRLAPWARAQHDDPLLHWCEQAAAGVEVRVRTAATELAVTFAVLVPGPAGAAAPSPVVVVEDGGARQELRVERADLLPLGPDRTVGAVVPGEPFHLVVRAVRPAAERDVVVRLPHGARVEVLAIDADAPVAPVGRRPGALRWTHHGSSISHGLDLRVPDRPWPAQVARAEGWELTDLAFAGNAQLDGFTARTVRDVPADLVTLALGINLVNADSMRQRAMLPAVHAFLDTVREALPTTPVVLLQAVACPLHEDTPGPVVTGADGRMRAARRMVEPDEGALTLRRTREVLAAVHAVRCDPYLFLLDGRDVFGADDTHHLYDALHPDADGHDLIATRFPAVLRRVLREGPVTARPTTPRFDDPLATWVNA